MSIRRTRTRASRMFLLYAVVSLVPVIILGVVLGAGYRSDGERHALEQGRAQADVIAQMAVSPALEGATPQLELAQRQLDALWSAVDLAVFHNSITRLRIIDFQGRVVFSDDGKPARNYDARASDFRRAASGQQVATIYHDKGGVPTTVRVLQPIVTATNGRSVGVLDVRIPYAPIAQTVAVNTRMGFVRLGLGLVALYLLLALISWWSARALARFASDHQHQALHDSLTGLPNRAMFRQEVGRAMSARKPHGECGLALIDLDRFKEVNDVLGHHAGDELLQVVATRLAGVFRSDDLVARLGGDEFAVLLRNVGDAGAALELLGKAREQLREDIVLNGVTVQVDASMGLSMFGDGGRNVEELLQHADVAMYEGKRGPAPIVLYDPEVSRPDTSSLVLQHELTEAIDDDQLFMEYQPMVSLDATTAPVGTVVAVEALVRWQHPRLGRVAPDRFVPVAEKSHQIDQLTRWVLDRALRDCASWRAAGQDWVVSVNVSPRNLSSATFVGEVLEALARHGVPHDQLVLEITETATPYDPDVLRGLVSALGEAQVKIAIDDFGAGATSLAQLRGAAFSELKVDRQFVDRVDVDSESAAIVATLIEMAHRLGCSVTAEGVETEAVARWLLEHGCDRGQGFLWARPAPWQDLVEVGELARRAS